MTVPMAKAVVRAVARDTPAGIATIAANATVQSNSTINQAWTDRRMLMEWAWGTELGGPVHDNTINGGTAATDSFVSGALSLATSNNAQGIVLWDPEGYQNYGDQSGGLNTFNYVGDQRVLSQLNPMVNGVIDGYMTQVRNAGLKVGFAIRAQSVDIVAGSNNFYASQAAMNSDMIAKAQYSITRWGASIFYVDTNDRNTNALFQAFWSAFGGSVLFIPEHTYDDASGHNTTLEAAFLPYSAPLTYAPDVANTINTFPQSSGFAAIYLDAATSASTITANQSAIVTALKNHGSILGPVVGWYDSPQLGTVPAIKSAAGYP